MPEDNIRGNIGGEAGFVLQDCQSDSVFYFIRKKSAIRIQKNWRHFNDKTAKTNECPICRKQYKFMSVNYYCLHKICTTCYKEWDNNTGNCPLCRAKPLMNKISRI